LGRTMLIADTADSSMRYGILKLHIYSSRGITCLGGGAANPNEDNLTTARADGITCCRLGMRPTPYGCYAQVQAMAPAAGQRVAFTQVHPQGRRIKTLRWRGQLGGNQGPVRTRGVCSSGHVCWSSPDGGDLTPGDERLRGWRPRGGLVADGRLHRR